MKNDTWERQDLSQILCRAGISVFLWMIFI